MNGKMRHSQIIFLCSFLLVLVGCHNTAHLRTQKILKPGEKAYSASGVLAMGGVDENSSYSNTGVVGLRGEVSMLKGGKDSEAGPYFGVGEGDYGPGLILGYDYRKYTGQSSGQAKKLGAQIEVNFSGLGQTLHLRPSITSTTKRGRPLYGGLHGILAVGNLMDNYAHYRWETVDSSEVYEDNLGNISYGSDWHNIEEGIDYRFNSLGAGITAGAEFLAFNNNSIQLQVDVSLVKNSFNIDGEPPNIDMENVTYASWDDGEWDERYGSHDDDRALMVTGSIGMSFFKPGPTNKESFEPLPAPAQIQPQPIFDAETGERIPGGMRFNPETGEAIIEKQFDPETGEAIVETQFNPETGTQGTTLSQLEIQSLALANARQTHVGPLWGLLGLAGCGTGLMGGIMGGETADFPGFILGGALGLSLPSLLASGTASSSSVLHYPAEIKTQSGKQLYKDAYVKEKVLLRRRSTVMGTGVGLLGFGAFMLVLISSF